MIGRLINKFLGVFSLKISRVKKQKSKKISDKTVSYFSKQKYLEDDEFKYILWIDRVYDKIRETPGYILELGVAYGRNAIIFSKLAKMNGEDSVRRYIGFDTFSGYNEDDLEENKNLSGSAWKDNSKDLVQERLKKAGVHQTCELIEGDLLKTLPEYLDHNPDLRIALLYVDCNAYKPALEGMKMLKDYMTPGGIICIDEKKQGGETKALIEFCQMNGLKFKKDASPFSIPAYTVI